MTTEYINVNFPANTSFADIVIVNDEIMKVYGNPEIVNDMLIPNDDTYVEFRQGMHIHIRFTNLNLTAEIMLADRIPIQRNMRVIENN
jgi:hypothetical protein